LQYIVLLWEINETKYAIEIGQLEHKRNIKVSAAANESARHAASPHVLYTNVDTRYNKLANIVDRTKLTALATVDMTFDQGLCPDPAKTEPPDIQTFDNK